MPVATAPTRTGYAFQGYYDQTGGNGTRYYQANMTSARNWDKTANATLYAYWTVVCTYSISPTSRSHTSAAGTGSISVTAGSGCAWTATESLSWVSITSGSSGSGNGTVSYSVDANPAGSPARSGTITVAGQSFTVSQSAGSGPTLADALEATSPGLIWTTGGSANWLGQTAVSYDGVDAAQSGAIDHSQESWVQTTVVGPGTVSFWWKVSSESCCDHLRFYIDGNEQDGRIAGEVDWQHQSIRVSAGTHLLKWSYIKDGSVVRGSDCGWLDQVFWTAGSVAINDYDGDGTTDAATFRPANGNWSRLYRGGGSEASVTPVPADYEGDGITALAVYHPAGGKWYIRQSTAGDRVETFGWAASIPLPGDYDGDGRADLAVFHRPTARWYFRYSNGGPDYNLAYGWSAVIPVPADYDGDGATDIAVYYRATASWYISYSGGGSRVQSNGWSPIPVPADYDGDGKADIAEFYRPLARWYVIYSTGGSALQDFGWSGTLPVPADYDGDGKADLAVYHPAGGKWYVLSSQTGATLVKTLGGSDRQPVLLNSLIHAWFMM